MNYLKKYNHFKILTSHELWVNVKSVKKELVEDNIFKQK